MSKGEKRMKFQISYNTTDLAQALDLAKKTAEYADILGIGSLLLLKEGVNAIKVFKQTFPNKELFAEAKIIEKADDAVTILSQAGANYVSILAGSFHVTIKKAVVAAKAFDTKIIFDLFDAQASGQSAADARALGVHAIMLHRTPAVDEMVEAENEWRNVRDNTTLPLFVTGKIDLSNINHLLALKPQTVMIGSAISKANDPAKTAAQFRELISGKE
jgi:3-hexulose-6-phosphate synthase